MKKIYLVIFVFFICHTGFGQLSGIKSIPGDYPSILAAITALNALGVGSGGVTFNVVAGYTETASNLIITATGTLANPILFQKYGSGADPLVTASAGVSTTLDGIIILKGTDYITFNGIDLKDPATNTTSTTQMEWGYALLKNSATDGCQNVLITNCTITLQRIYTSSVGIYVANHLTTSTTALTVTAVSGANSNNKFYSNVIQNVNTGISITGFNDVTSPYTYYDQNNDIGGSLSTTGNTIQNFGGIAATNSYGVNVIYQNGCNISYNTVNNTAGGGIVSAYVIYGIQYNTSTNATGTINNNIITLSQGNNVRAIYCISSAIGGTGSLTANGNSFTPSFVTGASGNLYCINITAAMSSNNINNNQFVNCPNLNTIGSIYFINNPVATSTIIVTSNMVNMITKPSPGGSFYCILNSGAPIGGTETINSNTISNITLTGNTTFVGINTGNSSTQNIAIYYNTIQGITGGSASITGINLNTGNTCNVYGNTVNTITNGNGGIGSGVIYGYFLGTTTTVSLSVFSNTAYGITNSNNGITYGLIINGGINTNVFKNSIYNLTGSAVAANVCGLYFQNGPSGNFYNNFVSALNAPNASGLNAISGIYINSGTTIGIYYNSIYLNAVSTAGTFGTSGIYTATGPTVDFRNNNVVNVSTPMGAGGYTVAYRRSSTTLTTYASISNNNNFYAGTPSATNLIFYDGTNSSQTLSAYKSFMAPRDGQSISENPPFVNISTTPYDLHLKTTIATSCESGGTVISSPVSIVMDYNGDARYPNSGYPNNVSYPATAPDIGADETAGIPLDVNGPVINYTILLNTSSTTNRTLTATITDVSGVPTSGIGLPRLYWKVNAGTWNFVAGVSIGGNQYTFTFGAGVIIGDVVSYYIVAQDNDTPTPLSSANPAIGASGYTVNPPAVSTPPTSPNTYTILGSLCGSYNVGAGQTYTTLTAAIADLNAKAITCPVTFLLTDATYSSETFPITIVSNVGSTATNTVTISPAGGVTPTITGSSATGILILNGADNVIIDGSNSGGTDKSLTWINTNTAANAYTIGFANAGGTDPATNNIIRNCNIKASSQVTNNTYGIYMNSTGGGYDNIVINNNTIFSARYGILFGGATTVIANNGQITNNIIGTSTDATSIQYRGITLQYANNTLISGNEIMGAPAGNSNYYQAGIYITTGSINTRIRKNKIHDWYYTGTGGWGNYGIYYGSDASTVTEISNNLIYQIKGDGYPGIQTDSPYGIYIASGGNCQIWFNSISMTGALLSTLYTGALSACISINPGITSLDIRNNIFRNSMQALSGTPADFTYAVYSSSANTAFSTINNNDYWDDGIGPDVGYIGAANQATLAAWQTSTGQDAASVNVDPAFTSASDLHTTAAGLNKDGITISSITDDFAGTLRTDPPDIGAYQFSSNPVVTTTSATGVSCGSITLNGTINPNNANVTTGFDYGLTISYGFSVAGVPVTINGSTPMAINAVVTGMIPNVINHFRAKGTSGELTIYGNDMTITPLCPPIVITTAASLITSSGATLNGTVNANNLSSTVSFDYGLTAAYGTTVSGVPSPVAGGTATAVSAAITGLMPGITYHFRVNGTNAIGTSNGNDMTFTTLAAPPTVITTPATFITATTATLNGTVNCNGATTSVTFNYGLTPGYGSTISAVPSIITGNTVIAVSGNITGLTCNTLYHYRVSGTNSAGTSNGNDMTFTTLGAVSPAGPITGPTSICRGATGVLYTVAAITGATGYVWSLPAGGTITAGANTNTITVSFSLAASSGNVTVYGTNTCTNGSGSSLAITVNILPVPTITGPASACVHSTGNIYTTETGMTAYTWSISSGGIITAGAGTISITVTWNIAGAQTVSVNYTNSKGCMASSATVKNITVNPLPVPTITGLAAVCAGMTGVTYTTEAGNTGYIWSVSAGGTITAGSGTRTITVSWNTVGSQTVSVNYTNTNGCIGGSPTVKNVTVNPLPVPTISGANSVCAGVTGVTYITETGMTGYLWTVSAGGTITAGSGTNTITVTWNTAGARTVSVNYTNSNGCTANSPTIKNVIVNPVYIPTITGTNALCISTQTYVYTTETGMNNYIWHVSSGGTITSGGTTASHTVTIRWNTTGSQWVSVNYSNSYSCSAATATFYTVIVNPVPVPTITGSNKVCAGTTGVIYTTQPGMTNYSWSVSLGGIVTAGGTSSSNTVTVTWNTAGAQTVRVNYTNSYGCTASSPTSYPVTVSALPQPTLTGPVSICAGTAGNVYTTQAGMSNYIWYVSPGGIITAGGTSTKNTVTVTWNTAGTQMVSVNYYNSNGCTAAAPVILGVTVNALPVPAITGSSTLCSGVSGIYTTQSGNTNYTWTVSSGATIMAGGTTTSSSITVKWAATGSQWVRVNYTNSSGCRATTYTQFNITVNPLPVPSITGLKTVCQGSAGIVYTTQPGMTGYTWTISTGGIITAGTGTNSITVSWTGSGAQWVKVNYSNTFGCYAVTPVQYNVTVNQATVPSIIGIFSVCVNTTITYGTEAGMTNYIWTVSSGGTIISGLGTHIVNVLWNTPGANTISVIYTPLSGCPVLNPTVKAVTVYALPVPTITGPTSPCVGAYEFYVTEPGMTDYTWTLGGSGGIIYSGFYSHQIYVQWVTAGAKTVSVNYSAAGGCRAPTPTVFNVNVINCTKIMVTGSDTSLSAASFTVYPNPNNGRFTALIQCECRDICTLDVFNMMGVKVFELTNLNIESKIEVPIDLQNLPQGIYSVIFRNNNQWMIRKIVINK